MDHLHSSANSNVLRNAASPEVLEAALEAAERLNKDDVHAPEGQPKPRDRASRPAVQARDESAQANMEPPQHANVQTPAPESVAQETARDGEVAGQAGGPSQAAFQAATALAEGGQDAMRAWLELAQNATCTHVEALSRLAECRSWLELMYLQSSVLQQRLLQSVDFGDAVARAATLAAWKAADAMHAPAWRAQRPLS